MVKIRTRLFQSWFRLSRPMTLGVRALVVDEAGRILLVKHTYTPGWYLPGGGVERSETCETALRRELVEEGGVALIGDPKLLGVFSNHKNFPNDHVLLYEIAANDWEACETDHAGEISELKWCDPRSLPAKTTAGTVKRIEEWLDGSIHPQHWCANRGLLLTG